MTRRGELVTVKVNGPIVNLQTRLASGAAPHPCLGGLELQARPAR
jgi:hypothetical protein